jgi:prepilin-type N-terminal cleavage/methylation domain-containing protein
MVLMVMKAARNTMQICIAPMLFDADSRKCVKTEIRKGDEIPACSSIQSTAHLRIRGLTLTELVVVIVIVSLFVLLAQINLFGLLRKNTFRAQVQDIISTMQMAASAAAESNRRYEFIIDPIEQNYLLREITSPDLSQILQEEIIVENNLSDNCRVTYIEFDDGESINDGWAKFRVGHSGWQYGGKIVLLDSKERPYSVVVNRLNRTVSLTEGDVGLLEPKAKEEVPF